MVICLERGADLHTAQLMPLPLTVSCSSKIEIGFTFLVPAHPGSPGERAVKRVCVCGSFSQRRGVQENVRWAWLAAIRQVSLASSSCRVEPAWRRAIAAGAWRVPSRRRTADTCSAGERPPCAPTRPSPTTNHPHPTPRLSTTDHASAGFHHHHHHHHHRHDWPKQ